MKREIKFRGKRLDNGEWVYGDYFKKIISHGTISVVVHYIGWQPVSEGVILDKYVEVDPNTVGQYTDLGYIFEDDIINVRFGSNNAPIPMQVLFENGSWCMKEYGDDTLHDLYSYEDEIEGVLGNMYDSPEKFIME